MRAALLASWPIALIGIAGCSLWVSSEPEQIGCAAEGKLGPPACDEGFICARQSCVRCAAHEVCGDGIDNDCNGRVDDACVGVGAGGGNGGRGSSMVGAAGLAKPAAAGGGG